jgi:hypothetical protein
LVIFRDFSDFFGNWKFLVIFLVISLKVSKYFGYRMKFNQIRHNDTTCHSKIQWEQLQVHACKAVHPNYKLLAQAVQLNRRNPADNHSPCWARDPGITNSMKKYKWERKTWEKTQFQWWKAFYRFCFTECFIDFQTTLVDSRNLVIFSTFW